MHSLASNGYLIGTYLIGGMHKMRRSCEDNLMQPWAENE